jgi:acetylglutamate kinase
MKIVKIGGNIVDNADLLQEFLTAFSKIEEDKILIHGGGKIATEYSEKLGIKVEMLKGRRITSKESLDVALMTYAGLVNKKIVASLQSLNCNSLGLSGADGNVIIAERRIVKDVDYGYVGDIEKVNSQFIKTLIDLGLSPIFCALTHDGNGQMLNTNADSIASSIATAMSEHCDVELIYIFEKPGVLSKINDSNSVIQNMDYKSYQNLKADGSIHDGMLPKLDNCFNSLNNGVAKVVISNIDYFKDNSKVHTQINL